MGRFGRNFRKKVCILNAHPCPNREQYRGINEVQITVPENIRNMFIALIIGVIIGGFYTAFKNQPVY